MEASDQDLPQQFPLHRREAALHRLVNRHAGMVFGVARRVNKQLMV